MRIPVTWLKIAVAVAVLATAIWLWRLWQPERQVLQHTENLLARASSRDWSAVEAMMADDYRDVLGRGRTDSIDGARRVLSHFFTLQVAPLEPWVVEAGGGSASATARVGVFGRGTGGAELIMEEARKLEEPFVFRWRKAGSWPWQWELTGVDQQELERRFRNRSPEAW